jgi:hypothetical protein
MFQPRQHPAGPFARCIHEALESAVSPTAASNILAEALKRASLRAVPEDSAGFRQFCEGPFRAVARSALGDDVQIVFERLGHVLWMATSDVQALNAAREWSERPSGTHLAPQPDSRPPASGNARESGPSLKAPTLRARPSIPTPRPLASRTATTIGAMPAVTANGPRDPSPPSSRTAPLPPIATPVRASPTVASPSSVLVVTLDPQLIDDVERELAARSRVKSIRSVADLAAAAETADARCVVVIDTALPSIDLPTFARLRAMLPREARVVLWGVALHQQQRLASMFPEAASWIPSGAAASAGRFVLDLER